MWYYGLPAEYADAYHPQCSAIAHSSAVKHEVDAYDPASGDYYQVRRLILTLSHSSPGRS